MSGVVGQDTVTQGEPGEEDDMGSPRGILTNVVKDTPPDVTMYRKLYITARMPSVMDADEVNSPKGAVSEEKPVTKSAKSVRFSLPADEALETKLLKAPIRTHYETFTRRKSDTSLPAIVKKRQSQRFDPKFELPDDPTHLEDTIDKVLEANRPSTVHGGRGVLDTNTPPYIPQTRGSSGSMLSRRYTYLRPPTTSAQQRLRLLASNYAQPSSRDLLQSQNSRRKEVLKTKSFHIHSPGKPFPKAPPDLRKRSSISSGDVSDFRGNRDFMDVYRATVNDLYTIRFRNPDQPEIDPYSDMRSDYYSLEKNDGGALVRPPKSTIPQFKEINGMLHGVPKRLHCRENTEYNMDT